jgi:hypothetical protein
MVSFIVITHPGGRLSDICRERILAACRRATPLHWTLILSNNSAGNGQPGGRRPLTPLRVHHALRVTAGIHLVRGYVDRLILKFVRRPKRHDEPELRAPANGGPHRYLVSKYLRDAASDPQSQPSPSRRGSN